jgi:hypothetical protein
MTLPDQVVELVDRFRRARETYESDAYSEASVRQEFIDPLFRALGWDVGNLLGWADQNKEVLVEPYVDVEGRHRNADYAFRVGPQEKFFVEAKRPSTVLRIDPAPALQIRSYGWNAGLPLSVLTNFGEFAVYDTAVKPQSNDRASVARLEYFTFEEFNDRWDWMQSLFGRDSVWRGSLEEFSKKRATRRGTEPVGTALLLEIERWRHELAREIANKNPDLSVNHLNSAVQTTIDRVMFLRICEDRDLEPYGSLLGATKTKDVYGDLLRLFRRADARYNSGLFHFDREPGRPSDPDTLTPDLKIGNQVLQNLLLDLYPPSPFNFRVIRIDVLGMVYEQFLGEVIKIGSARKIIVEPKPEVKKAGGVVYTPESVVRYIIDKTLTPALTERNLGTVTGRLGGKRAHPLRVLDPACGSGSFLIAVYQGFLDWYLAEYLKEPDTYVKGRSPAIRPTGPGNWQLTTSERKRILLEHIYGVDIDAQAVEVTKLSLLLKCLEGETEATIAQQMTFFQSRALPDLDQNIRCGNSLIGIDYAGYEPEITTDPHRMQIVNMFDWESEFEEVFSGPEPGFDIVLGNPPYVLLQDEFRDDHQLEYFRERYGVAAYKLDTYHLFIEKSLQLTRDGGWFSMITPSNYLTNNHLVELRSLLLDHSAVESITIIDGSVFPRRSVDCAVIVARPKRTSDLPFQVLHASPGPHHTLDLTSEGRVDPLIARETEGVLFTGTAEPELASALQAIALAPLTLGEVARVHFGKQLRDRKKYVEDVVEVSDSALPSDEYVRCLTGRDISRWSVRWGGNALLDEEIARRGGCWDPEIQNAKNKILTRQIGAYPIWGLDSNGYQCLNTIFMVVVQDLRYDPLFLLGLLNASPLRAYWLDRFYDQRTTFPKIKGTYLKRLPLPLPPDAELQQGVTEIARELIRLTGELEDAKTASERELLERGVAGQELALDVRIAGLYGLSKDQLKVIQGVAKR